MSDNNPNIFPLDEFNPDQQKGKDASDNKQSNGTEKDGISQGSEDPILFPLDEYKVTQPAPSPKKRAATPASKSTSTPKTTTRAKSATTVRRTAPSSGPTVNYNPNPPVNPTPTGTTTSPTAGTKSSSGSGCGGCLTWIILIIALFYFRDTIKKTEVYKNYVQPTVGKYLDGLENWVKEHNPIGNRKSAFEKLKKENPILHLDEANKNMYALNRQDTFSTETLILTGKTGIVRKRHLIEKGTKKIKFKKTIKNKIVRKPTPVRLIQDIDSLLESNTDLNQRILVQEWSGGPLFYVTVDKLGYYQELELTFIPDSYEAFERNESGTIYLPEYIYQNLLSGFKNNWDDFSDIPISKYEKVETEEVSLQSLMEKADKEYDKRQYESAKATYSKILSRVPMNKNAILGRGNTLLMLNDFDKALKDYNTVISMSIQEINRNEYGPAVINAILYRGVTEYFRGNYDKAVDDLNRVIDRNTSIADAYLYRGLCFKQLSLEDNGCSDFKRALELGRKDAEGFICSQ